MFAVSYIHDNAAPDGQEPRERLLPQIYGSREQAQNAAVDLAIREGFYTNVWDLDCTARFALDGTPL